MAREPNPHPLRLRRKHGDGRGLDVTAADGARLARRQSMRGAVTAGLIAILAFCIAWAALTSATGRVLTWMTVVLGAMVGYAVRYAGRGIDRRFPVLAAVLTLAGAVGSNVVVAATTTAAAFGTDTLHVLRAVTGMTWPVFFEEHWNAGDTFFAVLGAGLAAFLAPRKLTRRQFYAVRLWREDSDGH